MNLKQLKSVIQFAALVCVVVALVWVYVGTIGVKASPSVINLEVRCTNGQIVSFAADRCKPSSLGNGKWVYFVNNGVYDTSMCTCSTVK
jgi:hypothetical protein